MNTRELWDKLVEEGKQIEDNKIFVNDGRKVKDENGKLVEIHYLEKLSNNQIKLVAGGKPTYYSRFNSGVVTISLPDLALSSKGDFDKFVTEHSLNDRIEYYPGLYGDEKDRYFQEANVFLLPSYYINEGQPVSIIEAMAYGCVPVVTNYRHIPMMVDNSNGFYVKPKSPEDIAEKVKYLILHPEEYADKSQKAIKDYQQKFKFEVFATRVIDCMNNVIS